MGYEEKRQILWNLRNVAWDKKDWYEADVIRDTIAIANNAAKTDIEQAHAILDRLEESEYCTKLRKEIEGKRKNKK